MRNPRFKVMPLVLILTVLFNSGCATIQRAKKADELEKEIAQLTQSIKEKESQIDKLQDLLNDRDRQLQEQVSSYENEIRALRNKLNALKAQAEARAPQEPNLK